MARYKQIARKSVGSRSPRQIVAAIGNTASNQSGPIPPQPPTPSKESTAGSTRRASIQAACDSITRATHLHTIDRNQSSPADAGASARGKKIILKAYSNTGGRRQSASEAPEEEAEESPSSLFLTNDVADETAGNQPPAADDEADLLSRIEQISSSVSVLERSLGDRMTMIEESLKGISETMDTRSTYLGERLNKMDELLSEMAVHLGVRKSPECVSFIPCCRIPASWKEHWSEISSFRHVNDLARLENSRIRNSSTPLAPLVHPKTGSPIDNFPGTEAELCLLHRKIQSCQRIPGNKLMSSRSCCRWSPGGA